MVVQKNADGELEVSDIARMIVNTITTPCTKRPHTIRVVKLPLKISNTQLHG